MNKYIVAVVGFNSIDKVLPVINQMMEKEGIWLFTIAGSGTGIAKDVANKLGCPFQYCQNLKELEYQCNYLIADISAGQNVKNFVLKMKAAGKHGIVVR